MGHRLGKCCRAGRSRLASPGPSPPSAPGGGAPLTNEYAVPWQVGVASHGTLFSFTKQAPRFLFNPPSPCMPPRPPCCRFSSFPSIAGHSRSSCRHPCATSIGSRTPSGTHTESLTVNNDSTFDRSSPTRSPSRSRASSARSTPADAASGIISSFEIDVDDEDCCYDALAANSLTFAARHQHLQLDYQRISLTFTAFGVTSSCTTPRSPPPWRYGRRVPPWHDRTQLVSGFGEAAAGLSWL